MTKLVGTAPNQVPTNADLGKLAYQDAIANGTGTAGQVLQSGGATGSAAWATFSTTTDTVVWPSDFASPTTTYTSSGTWSKGSLADDDYVWLYLIGGGNGGNRDVGPYWYASGSVGGPAILVYGKASVFNGGTYAIGAGGAGAVVAATNTSGAVGGHSTFTLSNGRVFSTALAIGTTGFFTSEGGGQSSKSIEGTSVEANVLSGNDFLVPSTPPTGWTGYNASATNATEWFVGGKTGTQGGNSIFGGGASGGSTNASSNTAGASLYAGNGVAVVHLGAGNTAIFPGGAGGSVTGNANSHIPTAGANGAMRQYNV